MIRNKMVEHYITSRKRIKKEEADKLRSYEESRARMTESWKTKMADSPYQIDQYQQDELRRKRQADRLLRNKIYNDKVALVASMSGRASDKVLTKENFQPLDPRYKLAIGLRQAFRDEEVIKQEKATLDQMLHNELFNIANKFSTLPILDEISRSGGSARGSNGGGGGGGGGTVGEGSTLSNESQLSEKQRNHHHNHHHTTPGSPPKSNGSKGRKTKASNLQTESSTISGSLGYTSPNQRMKELQEQASLEFSVRNFSPIAGEPPLNNPQK